MPKNTYLLSPIGQWYNYGTRFQMLKIQAMPKALSVLFFRKLHRWFFIARECDFHHEENSTTSRGRGHLHREGKSRLPRSCFFMPGFQFRDGIPSLRSHPGVVELTIYCEFSSIYICICSRPRPFYNVCSIPIQNYSKAIINYCLSIIIFKLLVRKIATKRALLLQ